MAHDPAPLPGKGFFGWLGRQVGYVSRAVKTELPAPPPSKTVFRDCRIEELPLPQQPNITLRRTVIDEVVIDHRQDLLADDDPTSGRTE